MKRISILRHGLFAAATALALGFGARQALAAPGVQGATAACSATWAAKCNQLCIDKGYDYGTCDAATGNCRCWLSTAE